VSAGRPADSLDILMYSTMLEDFFDFSIIYLIPSPFIRLSLSLMLLKQEIYRNSSFGCNSVCLVNGWGRVTLIGE
jgi:hypothetical protein